MAKQLTPMMSKFVDQVLQGVRPTPAARIAGSKDPQEMAWRWMRHDGVKKALRERRQAALDGDIASLAMQTIRELVGGVDEEVIDPETGEKTIERVQIAPAAVRYQASKWVLEHAGHANGTEGQQGPKDLTEMSASELSEVVNGGMQALTELAQQLNGHHIVDDQARPIRELNAIEHDDDDASSLLD